MIGTERTCAGCGLSVRVDCGYQCYVSKQVYAGEDLSKLRDCLYYCQPLEEDGEPLSPEQLLLLRQNELDQKRLRGPLG
jgi:hypothetical protein